MDRQDLAIREIVVAGDGITAWSAAATLKRRIPGVSVTLVPVPSPPDALADRITSTLPSIVEFHRDLGLTEADTVVRAESGFRLGTWFEGWAKDQAPYFHAYGEYGRPFGTASFHHHWIRASHRGFAAAFDSHSPAAAIAKSGRFIPPQGDTGSPLAGFEYGLQINPPRYREMMRAYAHHLGVTERGGAIAEVVLRPSDGFIAALRLDDGSEVTGDLFIDCTGPSAILRSTLDSKFEDWSGWLACDRILFAEAPASPNPPALDKAVAVAAGWRWEAASPVRTSHGLVYASRHLSDGKARGELRAASGAEPDAVIHLRQGRRPEPWLRNCVAVGDAAVSVEPLEWTNLHLAHSAIDRIVAMIPDRDCAPVELWDYNQQSAAEANRVRDFLLLHYAVASRPAQPFWRAAAKVELPPSLLHSLSLFRERGRLPYYEEETFTRDSWLAVLLGQGIVPRRTDPLIDSMPAHQAEEAMARMRETIDAMVATLPTQTDYLRKLARQSAR